VVDAIGEGVTGFSIGDEIIVDPSLSCGRCDFCRNDEIVHCKEFRILGEHLDGTLAEYVVIPTINAVRKPEAMAWEVAGSFGLVTVTALRMIEAARLVEGQRVLIVGVGGGVSAAALGLSVGFRADVFVTSRSQAKIDWAISEGATAGFLSDSEFGTDMTELGGAHLVIESVGPATFKQSLRAARPGGRFAVCGGTSGSKVELNLPYLWFKGLEIAGSAMGTHAQFARATNYVGSGHSKAYVDRTFDFDELPAALAYLDSGEQTGKVVISR
jgi:D-arabinose 1-dehydrogenase-like Zn-dependent alcohol dehydrogenase